jgi:hypothetical protein
MSFLLSEIKHCPQQVRIIAMLAAAKLRRHMRDLNLLQDMLQMRLDAGNEILTRTDCTTDQEQFRIIDILDIIDCPGQVLIHLINDTLGISIALIASSNTFMPSRSASGNP